MQRGTTYISPVLKQIFILLTLTRMPGDIYASCDAASGWQRKNRHKAMERANKHNRPAHKQHNYKPVALEANESGTPHQPRLETVQIVSSHTLRYHRDLNASSVTHAQQSYEAPASASAKAETLIQVSSDKIRYHRDIVASRADPVKS